MSVESMAIALHHSRAKGAAKLVLIGIANHDGDGGAWPSVQTLGKYAHVDRRNVQRALVELERLGEIRRMVSAGGDHSTADHLRPNLYQFRLVCPTDCDRSRNHKTARDLVVAPPLTGLEEEGAALTPPGRLYTGAALASPEGAAQAPPKPPLELNNLSRDATPVRGRETNEDASGGSHQPASAVVEPWSNFKPFDPCPVRPAGHEYRAGEQRCRWCDIHEGQKYDPKSKEITWRESA